MAFEFFCPVNVVTNHTESAGFPTSSFTSELFGLASAVRGELAAELLAKSGEATE